MKRNSFINRFELESLCTLIGTYINYGHNLRVNSASSWYIYGMNEIELKTRALNKLEFHTGLVAKVTNASAAGSHNKLGTFIQISSNKANIVAELRRWRDHKGKDTVLEHIRDTTGSEAKILVADYIDGQLGARLRKAKVNYLDKVGNAYLDISPIFVLIEGKQPEESFSLDRTPKLFTETGLKVICALLTNENLLNANYRSIADHASVSMGTIGWVLRELKDQGYTQKESRILKWKNKEKLIETWIAEYPKLRSKSQYGLYTSTDLNWWKTVDLNKYGAVLGGELAANHTKEQLPRVGLIYVSQFQHKHLIRDLGLTPVEDTQVPDEGSQLAAEGSQLTAEGSIHAAEGSTPKQEVMIEIRNKFWGQTQHLDLLTDFTHPFITYADLMDTWDSLNIKLAKQISDKYFSDW